MSAPLARTNTAGSDKLAAPAAPPGYASPDGVDNSDTVAVPTMSYSAYPVAPTTNLTAEQREQQEHDNKLRLEQIHTQTHTQTQADDNLETGHGSETCTYTLCGKERVWRGKGGGKACCLLFSVLVGLAVLVLAGIAFGISVGVEKGLTGEFFWTPGHSRLFRICESASTSSKPFQVHTCNVFRLGQPLDAAPVHAFVEGVRAWDNYGAATPGRAIRTEVFRLDALLLNEGLRCSPRPGSVDSGVGVGALEARAQLVIGDVGQTFFAGKTAVACNYDRLGRNTQQYCARYGDGGQLSPGKAHPLSINEIFGRHFNWTCSWVV